MFTSLSAYRLRETASKLRRFTSAGTDFVVLRSKTLAPVDQYYIVRADWEDEPTTAQIEPLAHVNVTATGKTIFKTWQPEMFKLKESKQSFMQDLKDIFH